MTTNFDSLIRGSNVFVHVFGFEAPGRQVFLFTNIQTLVFQIPCE